MASYVTLGMLLYESDVSFDAFILNNIHCVHIV